MNMIGLSSLPLDMSSDLSTPKPEDVITEEGREGGREGGRKR